MRQKQERRPGEKKREEKERKIGENSIEEDRRLRGKEEKKRCEDAY